MAQRVYVTRVIPQPGIEWLRQNFDVDVNESDEQLTHEQLREKASSYGALVTLLTDKIDRDVLEAGKGKLKIVANVAVGYDNIDVAAATELGIMVSNTPGVLTETTADFAWTLLMAAARRVCEGDRFARAGKFHGWGIMMLLGGDVHHKTLGLIGFGRIGQAMARRAAGFGMRVLFYDPVIPDDAIPGDVTVERTELARLLRESDFVSVHTPLTEETRHLIDREQLETMKDSAYLVNTSRGPVVHEHALAKALRDKKIAGAGLDVYENEPQVDPLLPELENVVLAPHIASASVETRTRMATMAAENVIAALEGKEPPSIVKG
jgi:glyoxylate reductase